MKWKGGWWTWGAQPGAKEGHADPVTSGRAGSPGGSRAPHPDCSGPSEPDRDARGGTRCFLGPRSQGRAAGCSSPAVLAVAGCGIHLERFLIAIEVSGTSLLPTPTPDTHNAGAPKAQRG